MVDMAGFDRRLRRARLRRDISQVALAAEIGMTKAAYNRLERGKSEPSALTAGRLAEALGVDLKWLLFGDEREMPADEAWWKAPDV